MCVFVQLSSVFRHSWTVCAIVVCFWYLLCAYLWNALRYTHNPRNILSHLKHSVRVKPQKSHNPSICVLNYKVKLTECVIRLYRMAKIEFIYHTIHIQNAITRQTCTFPFHSAVWHVCCAKYYNYTFVFIISEVFFIGGVVVGMYVLYRIPQNEGNAIPLGKDAFIINPIRSGGLKHLFENAIGTTTTASNRENKNLNWIWILEQIDVVYTYYRFHIRISQKQVVMGRWQRWLELMSQTTHRIDT